MLLTKRCEQMLPNHTQCPNPIANDSTEYCLLHEQLNPAKVTDETNQNTNSIPENNTGE